ncbi:hypothetical protein GCM10010495_26650 [Kitasatospora herbaricolor]|uniref:hypothetical protein n=1 Tax=Kitasatospora herbaricolor TaxID=68217 RepID=UPI00174ABDFF|nr:hypothetical protein [Kitasatospora herbaricolor]MDQ0311135.1 hypothetical protein [Kitasatospora herbaricolor]GGV11804.1 hypothetical protein GCM10010495_26650 [Kitasatospora herbaricolor]
MALRKDPEAAPRPDERPAPQGRHSRPKPFGGRLRLPTLRFSGAAMAMSTVVGLSIATTWLLNEQQAVGRRAGFATVGATPPPAPGTDGDSRAHSDAGHSPAAGAEPSVRAIGPGTGTPGSRNAERTTPPPLAGQAPTPAPTATAAPSATAAAPSAPAPVPPPSAGPTPEGLRPPGGLTEAECLLQSTASPGPVGPQFGPPGIGARPFGPPLVQSPPAVPPAMTQSAVTGPAAPLSVPGQSVSQQSVPQQFVPRPGAAVPAPARPAGPGTPSATAPAQGAARPHAAHPYAPGQNPADPFPADRFPVGPHAAGQYSTAQHATGQNPTAQDPTAQNPADAQAPDLALTGAASVRSLGQDGTRHLLGLTVTEPLTALQAEFRLSPAEVVHGTTAWTNLAGAVMTTSQEHGARVYRFASPVGVDVPPGQYTFGVRGVLPAAGPGRAKAETWTASAFGILDPRAVAAIGAFEAVPAGPVAPGAPSAPAARPSLVPGR